TRSSAVPSWLRDRAPPRARARRRHESSRCLPPANRRRATREVPGALPAARLVRPPAGRDRSALRRSRGLERLLEPLDQRVGYGWRDVFVGQRAVFVGFAGLRRNEQVVDAGNAYDRDRRRILALARKRFEGVGVRRLDLRVELALHDEQRLAHVRHDLRRIVAEEALKFRIVDRATQVRRKLIPSLPAQDGLMKLFLQIDLRLPFFPR